MAEIENTRTNAELSLAEVILFQDYCPFQHFVVCTRAVAA